MLESSTYNLNNDFIDPSILFLDNDLDKDELYYFNARYYDATSGRTIKELSESINNEITNDLNSAML